MGFAATGDVASGTSIQRPLHCLAVIDPFDRRRIRETRVNATGTTRADELSGLAYAGFHAVLPPNSPSCRNGADLRTPATAWYSVTSHHPGGVMVSMVDASTRFITDSISVGALLDDTEPGSSAGGGSVTHYPSHPSRFGVWGALGSMNGGESLSAP